MKGHAEELLVKGNVGTSERLLWVVIYTDVVLIELPR